MQYFSSEFEKWYCDFQYKRWGFTIRDIEFYHIQRKQSILTGIEPYAANTKMCRDSYIVYIVI